MTVPANSPILTVAAMRAAELDMSAKGISLAQLMERAGHAVADIVWRGAAGRPVLILCGPGNNGGDGYVAARIIAQRGGSVRVAASAAPATLLAQAARAAWTGEVAAIDSALDAAPVIVDALFGVGLTRPIDAGLASEIARLSATSDRWFAVDVPSGVASDDGRIISTPAVADVTIALGALKPAHVLLPAASFAGRVVLADLGINLGEARARTIAPWQQINPDAASHKYSRGQVLVVAGAMNGAASLAAAAALRAGAGHVLLHGAANAVLDAIVIDTLSLADRLADGRVGAVVIGPGHSCKLTLATQIAAIFAAQAPVVIDAAAIGPALPWLDGKPHPSAILTPHGGEFGRFFGSGGGSKIDRTVAAANRTGAVIIHKGADTIIAAPDGRVAAGWPGCPYLASAGTGDVLAGACAALLAGGDEPFTAAQRAVAWHSAAGWHVGPGLVADDLISRTIL